MTLENKKVDDLWKQLNAKPIVKDSKKFDQVWSQFQQPSLSMSKKAGSKKENSSETSGGWEHHTAEASTTKVSTICARDEEPTAAEVCEG